MKIRQKSMALLCGVLCTGMMAVPVLADTEVQKYTNTDFAMDTVVSETLYTTGKDLNTTIGEKIREIETEFLSWTDENSQIAKLNAASGETTEVSEELTGYLEQIFQLAQDSDGAFDPTIGKIIRLWDITGEDPHVPEQSELDELLNDVGYQKVSLDGNKVTLEKGMTLDLGATGKGIGCDVVADFLKTQKDVSGMILNLGGSSVMAYGEKPDGSDWKVAVTDPRDTEGDYLGAITLEGGEFLSTSGDYEKYFMEDGKRYHHILDPKTGYPVWNGLDSVTVVCDSGLLADGLSTACFVLGMDDAMELLEKYNAEAVFVDEDKNVYLTDGIKDRFELMKNTYTVKDAK
ncbi:FAD:protein FMN transferase [Blautia sp. MSJ-19]|uniref:FAD:protein FMN transferase n=1 Tax=Blautia sp. MSJ-19 TaxID=2841517 RepID=UPI001C0EE419|nr:FAD:protein FMN transferase [Blautia sp. MSJ-19]MBU5480801.1 FAD:protein FMN transferase [Blautia sp. MSJ-19]